MDAVCSLSSGVQAKVMDGAQQPPAVAQARDRQINLHTDDCYDDVALVIWMPSQHALSGLILPCMFSCCKTAGFGATQSGYGHTNLRKGKMLHLRQSGVDGWRKTEESQMNAVKG